MTLASCYLLFFPPPLSTGAKVTQEKELTKPELTDGREEGMLPCKTESMELLGPDRNIGPFGRCLSEGLMMSQNHTRFSIQSLRRVRLCDPMDCNTRNPLNSHIEKWEAGDHIPD